jgi:hypothetical protein
MVKLVYLTSVSLDETMAPWETSPELAAQSDITAEFAGIWSAASWESFR